MTVINLCKTSFLLLTLTATGAIQAVPVEVKPLTSTNSSASAKNISDNNAVLSAQLAQFQEELQRLKQKNDEQEQQITALKEEVGKKNATPLKKLSTIFSSDKLPSVSEETQPVVDTTPAVSSQPSVTSPFPDNEDKKAYIQAYETFRTAGAEKAAGPMKDFISRYPNSPYMPNAHYWLGEFYLASNPPQFAKAKQEFNLVYKQYPKTTKAAAATYRLATMAEVEDNSKLATSLMEFILTNYPKSQEAGFARNYLIQNGKLKPSAPKPKLTTSVRPQIPAEKLKTIATVKSNNTITTIGTVTNTNPSATPAVRPAISNTNKVANNPKRPPTLPTVVKKSTESDTANKSKIMNKPVSKQTPPTTQNQVSKP